MALFIPAGDNMRPDIFVAGSGESTLQVRIIRLAKGLAKWGENGLILRSI